jgi:hypothetical protein
VIELDDLLADVTKEDWRADLYGAAQGRGFVLSLDGTGTGTIALAGTPRGTYEVRVRITALSGLQVSFDYSIDGGVNWTSATTDTSGAYAFSALGVAMQFQFDGYEPFVVGDVYLFNLFAPTLPADSWQEGAVPRTFLDMDAAVLEELSRTQKGITRGGFIQLAKGGWADLAAQNVYNEERVPAKTTVGNVKLTDAAGAGPFSVSAGQLVVESDSGKRFSNVAALTIPASGNVTAQFQAEAAGADYNVAAGSIIRLLTTLPGVTVTNPNPLGGSWITRQGRNKETDAELAARCVAKWGSLGVGATDDGYFVWATRASENVTRTYSRVSPTVPGQVDLFIAGPGGAVDAGTIAAVDAYVQPRVPSPRPPSWTRPHPTPST